MRTDRRDGLTLAPEAARDDMRRQIGKQITNDDLLEGCRRAMENGFSRVKLYFMCGLPGERPADLDGIIDMAEEISRLGKGVAGRAATVVANVSNFVPKPQTPYQWNAMQRREYFEQAHEHLRRRKRLRSVTLRCHDVDASLLEGVLCRGDRRVGRAVEPGFPPRGPTGWLGRAATAVAVVAGPGRRGHQRRGTAAQPAARRGPPALGSYPDPARTGIPEARATALGGTPGGNERRRCATGFWRLTAADWELS